MANALKINAISFLAFLSLSGACFALPASDVPKTEEKPAAKATVRAEGGAGSYLSGRFARMSGDSRGALRYLQDVHEREPNNMVVAVQLRDALLQEGRMDEVLDMSEKIHALDKTEVFANLMMALREIKRERYADAGRLLDASYERAAGQLWLPLVSGWVDVGRKSLPAPLKLEALSADVGRASSITSYHLGLINSAAGFTDEAASNFAQAVDDPSSPPARLLDVIMQFYVSHNAPSALKPFVDAYRATHTGYVMPKNGLVIATAHDGVAEIMFTMGSLTLASELYSDAVLYLQLALYVKPDFPLASLMLGEAYAQMQEYEKSNRIFAALPPQNEFYARTRQRMAINYAQMGRIDEGIMLLDKMAAASDEPDALMSKGDLLRQEQRFAEAVHAYTAALARMKDSGKARWPLLFARGVCYERTGQWEKAEADFQEALKINPNQPEVLNYLGYGWLERGQNLSEARVMLEKALRVRPNDPQILDSVGWAMYLTGNYNDAVRHIEKAVNLLPGDAEVNDHLGDAYWRVGRKLEARYQWQRALSSSPSEKQSLSLQRKLKEGLPDAKFADTADKKPL